MNRNNSIVNHIASAFASRVNSMLTANIHDYQTYKNGSLARVVVSFNTQPQSVTQAHEVISALFNNEASVVANSFRRLNPERDISPVAVGFVQANRVIRPYEEKEVAKYTVMASNILMDRKDESLWELKDTNGTKTLCRQSEEDLSELLSLARVRRVGIPNLASFASTVRPAEFVSYVSDGQVKHGFVLAELENEDEEISILPVEDSEEEEVVESARVIETAHLGNLQERFPEISASGKEMKAYYKEVYGFDTEFFRKLSAIIDQHAVA